MYQIAWWGDLGAVARRAVDSSRLVQAGVIVRHLGGWSTRLEGCCECGMDLRY